ncbi:hypothetical protein PR202_ga13035 [Eleusine coracana subsp. coracana]|uniref:2Fe-2S ferredoxin-type domain-containing protein n=1 Tax=Eleusine coracana subsp. coracana TaxID=191504 RepID=A0AAV5CDU9_ELECO|nr:hypothetical protein PR202_ga13035 [Eleusine coracana subsp. coracana]
MWMRRSEASRGVLVGSAASLLPSAARDTRARASSELQQAPRPAGAAVASHKVTVHDRQRGVTHEFVVPEDQYILHTAEAQDISLPFACRHGQIRQPEALGISAELKDQVYWLQFGRYFARGPVERDDYALELAMGDE